MFAVALILVVLLAAALVIHLALRAFNWWLDRVPVEDEPVRRAHITLNDPLSPDPFVSTDHCEVCLSLQPRGAIRCWSCLTPFERVVEAQPTDEPTWPGGGRAA